MTSSTVSPDPSVAARVAAVERRLDAACRRAGRERSSVTLVGASKQQSPARILAAWHAGVRIFGESRVQEARDKRGELPAALEWHLVGPLQSNKVSLALELFSTFHAVDRPKIAHALDRHSGLRGQTVQGFLEVNLGDEPSKHGFSARHLLARALPLLDLPHLRLVGLMALPPLEEDPERTRGWFRQLRLLRDELRVHRPAFPGLLSMGMSGDFELAVEEEATHVRVGSALFGPRP